MIVEAEEYTLWVRIDCTGDCHGELRKDGRLVGTCFGSGLSPDTTLMVKKSLLTFEELTHRIINYDLDSPDNIFDGRGQLEIGRHLFAMTAGAMVDEQKRDILKAKVAVRIVTEDETVSRLPWCLLAESRSFLAADKWSVALSLPRDDCRDYALPSHPRILLVAPCPIDWTPTGAEEHIVELERLLFGANDEHRGGKDLRRVENWDDFITQLESFKPHVVYYYGHGRGDENSSWLVFKKSGELEADEVPLSNFALALKRLNEEAPLVAYVNCCQGDAGGLLGVSKQLGGFIPAVITNCTTAYVDAARKQAVEILKGLLVERKPPHEAVSAIRINLDKLGLFFRDLRWLTPVLHYGYNRWSCEPTDLADNLNLDFNWRHKLDRGKQFIKIIDRTEWIIGKPGPRAFAFLTFGRKKQGFLDFYRRVEIELPDRISGQWLPLVRPAWPLEFGGNYYQSFSEKICEAFDVTSLHDIPIKFTNERDKVRKFLLLQHKPIELPEEGDLPIKHLYRLQKYLQWLSSNFVRIMPNNVFTIIGFSFVVPVPETFRARAKEMLERGLDLEFIRFSILDELAVVTTDELEDFLEVNDLSPPRDSIVATINTIIHKTGGIYEDVVEAVKNIDEIAEERLMDRYT